MKKILLLIAISTIYNAHAGGINNCDSTCFGNPVSAMGVQQNVTSSQTNNGQVTYVAPAPVASNTNATRTACGPGYVVDYSMSNYGGCVTDYSMSNYGGLVRDYSMGSMLVR